jgi:hypothetical protein
MIRQGAELHNSSQSNNSKRSNVHSGDWYDDILNHDMELDDHQPQGNNWDRMETEESADNHVEYQNLLQETLLYGQFLQAEFKDDPRREVSKALEDAFSLMAYEDPLNAKEVAHLLDPSGRQAVAEELNSAILRMSTSLLPSPPFPFLPLPANSNSPTQSPSANPPPPPSKPYTSKPPSCSKTCAKPVVRALWSISMSISVRLRIRSFCVCIGYLSCSFL